MRASSLAVLDRLHSKTRAAEARGVARDVRLTELLRSPDLADESWFMYVDERFNSALGIAQTMKIAADGIPKLTWTQGTDFSVSTGDRFYDSRKAYELWSVANVKRCFAVSRALPVAPAAKDKKTQKFTPRFAGSVEFDILEPDSTLTALLKTGHRAMTQDEFVRVLIRGFEDQLTLSQFTDDGQRVVLAGH